MRVVVSRSMPGESISMDVYADGLVTALRELHPQWEILEASPRLVAGQGASSRLQGIHKYYEKFLRYPRELRQYEADLYHVIDQSYAHLVYWLTDMRVVATCHDLINFRQPENLRRQARFPLLSMSAWRFSVRGLSRADCILADSEQTALDMRQMLRVDGKCITVVPVGIDPIFYDIQQKDLIRSFRAGHGASHEDVCLIHVGGNAPRKNVSVLLSVVKVLRSKGVPSILWKTGVDFTLQQKHLIQEYGIEGNVVYLGKLSRDEGALTLAYNAADVAIIPSLYEGFGMPVLEAMACGTPVITSNTSSLPEVAGDAARLISPYSVEEIVDEVLLIVDDPILRQQLVDKGLSRARMFSWDVIAERIASIYKQVAMGRSYAHPDDT